MPLKTWNGSSWAPAKSIRVWNGSSWVSAKSGKIWNGSSWSTFFGGTSVNISNLFYPASASNFESASAEAQYRLLSSGLVQLYRYEEGFETIEYVSGEWLTSGTASDISVKFTVTSWSGNYPSSSTTFGTWNSLSVDQYISVWAGAVAVSGQVTQNSFAEIKVDLAFTNNTSVIIDTANIQLSATASAYA